MASSTSWLVALLLLSLTAGRPENQGSTVIVMDHNTTSERWLLDTVKSALDNAQRQFTSWWQHVNDVLYLHLVKRDVKPELEEPENITANISSTEQPDHYFEEYEKMYLINQTMNMLEQMLLYADYEAALKNNCTNVTVGNRAASEDQRRQLRQLTAMTPNQLRQLFRNVTVAAKNGYVPPRISSTCCQIG